MRGQTGPHFFQAEALAEFNKLLGRCTGPLENGSTDTGEGSPRGLLEVYFAVREYLRVSEGYDDHYITQLAAFGGDVRASQLCLDPSAFWTKLFLRPAAVLFQRHAFPRRLLQGYPWLRRDKCAALPSPFDPARLGLYCAADV